MYRYIYLYVLQVYKCFTFIYTSYLYIYTISLVIKGKRQQDIICSIHQHLVYRYNISIIRMQHIQCKLMFLSTLYIDIIYLLYAINMSNPEEPHFLKMKYIRQDNTIINRYPVSQQVGTRQNPFCLIPGQILQPLSGKGGVSKCEKFSSGTKNLKQTNVDVNVKNYNLMLNKCQIKL